jgi:hypothetical protein
MRRRLAVPVTLVAGCLIGAAPARALDMPQRKPGLWELRMNFEGRHLPAQVIKQCIDAASDKLMNSNFGGPSAAKCAKQDVSHAGATMTVDSVCQAAGATTTSHAVITGSFDSAYTVDVTSTRAGGRPLPGMPPGGSTHMKIAAKWLGPCGAGQRPGDMIMSNGMKMNILDLHKMGAHRPPR